MTHLCEWPDDCGQPHDAACHDWLACLGLNLATGGALYAAEARGWASGWVVGHVAGHADACDSRAGC